MDREPVDSEGVVSVGYDSWSKALDVEFPGGAVYRYHQVPELFYHDLMTAPSKGRFVNFYIKPYFRYERIVNAEQQKAKASSPRAPARRREAAGARHKAPGSVSGRRSGGRKSRAR